KKELLIFLFLIILGAFLRIYKLDSFPAGFHGDEAWTGIEARRVLKDGFIGFWSPAALGQATLPVYWTAKIYKLLGVSIFTTRLSFVLLSIFSIPFFYLFIRKILTPRIAVVATFFFVTDSVSLALSRRADYVAANISFFPAIFFLFMAYETDKTVYFITSGVLLGLLNHSYAALWVTPILFVFIWGSLLITQGKKPFTHYINKFLILLLFYFIVASPILAFAIENKDSFFSRSQMISIFSEQGINHARTYLSSGIGPFGILLHNLKATLLMFNFIGDRDPWNTLSEGPILNPIMGIFFLAGFILGLNKYRHKLGTIIFLYFPFFFFLSGSIFTIDAPNIRRSQISAYFTYIFCGLGAVFLYNLLSKKTFFFKKVFRLIFFLIILLTGFHRTWIYFSKISVGWTTKNVLCYQLVKIADFVNTLPKDTFVYFYSSRWKYRYETLRFLLADYQGEDKSREFGKYDLIASTKTNNLVYIFLPEYNNALEAVEKLYPEGRKQIHYNTDGTLLKESDRGKKHIFKLKFKKDRYVNRHY
ncbi:glycosyltransferase family 39 protein, partial [Candidatus Microgenomates bacterium]|nr:glycosyltransferase family 39 protein [Candidatus Microgenomates bacterium]